MTPNQLLVKLKQIDKAESHLWTLPIRVCRDDAIAAELIEIAYKRIGENEKSAHLLNVAASMFWWVQLILSLSDDANSTYDSAQHDHLRELDPQEAFVLAFHPEPALASEMTQEGYALDE